MTTNNEPVAYTWRSTSTGVDYLYVSLDGGAYAVVDRRSGVLVDRIGKPPQSAKPLYETPPEPAAYIELSRKLEATYIELAEANRKREAAEAGLAKVRKAVRLGGVLGVLANLDDVSNNNIALALDDAGLLKDTI